MSNHTKLLCLFLKAQKINKSSDRGYAMAIVSLLTIILFSLLAASLVFSNLAKSRTDAFVDGTSAFAVAESGLNKRAIDLQAKLDTYSGLAKSTTPVGDLKNCFAVAINSATGESDSSEENDFECRNYSFNSSNNAAQVASAGAISLDSGAAGKNNYVAYTLVTDKTRYGAGGLSPDATRIPATEPFGGLNAAEYKYVVESVARKPVDSDTVSLPNYTTAELAALDRQQREQPKDAGDDALLKSVSDKRNTLAAGNSSNNTSLSMSFVTRVVPLFQFAIFYNGDLEFNSTSKMRVQGWVHSNANIYVQPAGIKGEENESTTDFLSKVSAAGSIYNRVDAWDKGLEDGGRTGITRVLLTGKTGDCSTIGNCQEMPAYSSYVTDPLTPTQINDFPNNIVQDGNAGTIELKVPSPGFTRKRNYADNKIGIYYSRADMRLEFVPDRDLSGAKKTTTPWTRDKAIIPFNFTSITTAGSACSKALPAADNDPATDYIDPTREKASTRRCNKFNKGQLQSLRQPVLVLTKKAHPTNTALQDAEREILAGPTDPARPEAAVAGRSEFPSAKSLKDLSGVEQTDAVKDKVLRALQVALVSTPKPIPFDKLGKEFKDSVYTDTTNQDYDSLSTFKAGFSSLIDSITELTPANRINLLDNFSPKDIARLRDAWFLPAPIQRVETTDTPVAAGNVRSSGFYDGREKRWISMLQTNIASLSVWNRDGLYVAASDEDLTTAYAPSATGKVDAFAAGVGANFTRGLAFDRSTVDATKTLTSTSPANLQSLGLGGNDRTEGGSVLHASVSDDLNGDGSITAADDITIDKTVSTNRVFKKKPDNTNEQDRDGNDIISDYYRNYPGESIKQSPFAFAFNGGNYLPNALILSSDQSVYVQGNFNNNASNAGMPESAANTPSTNRMPASIVADTITVLSNECMSASSADGVPATQLKCGLQTTTTGSMILPSQVGSPMAINAAFLSNTDTSIGNYHTAGETLPAVPDRRYSGGVNNYIRLLEDWQNKYALNYTGSMISLGAPLEYSGDYKSGGGDLTTRAELPYYNIPFRNFNYDDKFNKNENVPPLTPKASYVKQSNFNRVY